jgi:hypothetical protein
VVRELVIAHNNLAFGKRFLHLDSGVGHERADAHRLYFNAGFEIVSHHFARLVDR